MKRAVPAKPRWKRKAEERPSALYQAALDVFARRGYRAARLEEVAKAAGVSKGTIYNYFKNKEDLLSKALEEKRLVLRAKTEAAFEDFPGDASHKLRSIVETAWGRWMTEDWGRFNKLIFGEIAHELPALFELWAKEGLMEVWALVERSSATGRLPANSARKSTPRRRPASSIRA
jgi:AcrR family transcriptional regulator